MDYLRLPTPSTGSSSTTSTAITSLAISSTGSTPLLQIPDPLDPVAAIAAAMDHTKLSQDLIDSINACLFTKADTGINNCSFPLVINVFFRNQSTHDKIATFLAAFDLADSIVTRPDAATTASGSIDVACSDSNKPIVDDLIYKLKQYNDSHPDPFEYHLDYSNFLSHPGILFVKNLSESLVFDAPQDCIIVRREDANSYDNKVFKLFLENSHFKSLREIKLFHSEINSVLSCFAIVKFDNYHDIDIVMAKLNKLVPNPFNENKNVPLYLNKYLHRRERGNSNSSPSSGLIPKPQALPVTYPSSTATNEFDSIFIENLGEFFPPDATVDHFRQFVTTIGAIGKHIDLTFFPICNNEDQLTPTTQLTFVDYGFIKFESSSCVLMKVLKLLYYLNDLTWAQFCELDASNLEPLCLTSKPEKPLAKGVKMTIAQYKHNAYLFKNTSCRYLTFDSNSGHITTTPPNTMFTSSVFSKSVNYQETNIYVNNLPILFNNDDKLWEEFWKEFGVIKSAKIIKPHFYKEDEDELESSKPRGQHGKIGFVFYNDFKMSLRAILLTNNKLINIEGYNNPILIQSSFALQKPNAKAPHPPTSGHTNMYSVPMINSSYPQKPQAGMPVVSQPLVPGVPAMYPYVPYMSPPIVQPQVPYYNPYFVAGMASPPGQAYPYVHGYPYARSRANSDDNADYGGGYGYVSYGPGYYYTYEREDYHSGPDE